MPWVAVHGDDPRWPGRGRTIRAGYGPPMSDDAAAARLRPADRGDEQTLLLGFLDRQRELLAWKCDGMDAQGLAHRTAASTMTLGGLLKHCAFVENYWCAYWVDDEPLAPPWDAVDWDADPEWEWRTAAEDSPEQLVGQWRAAVADSRERVARALERDGLAGIVRRREEGTTSSSLRWVLLHLIEEYARHVGHADLLREAIDGQVGEDPPTGTA